MLMGIERLVDLIGVQQSGLTGATGTQVTEAVQSADVETLRHTDGHFAALAADVP